MLIEQNTNYAYKLKYMEHPTFEKVRDLKMKNHTATTAWGRR